MIWMMPNRPFLWLDDRTYPPTLTHRLTGRSRKWLLPSNVLGPIAGRMCHLCDGPERSRPAPASSNNGPNRSRRLSEVNYGSLDGVRWNALDRKRANQPQFLRMVGPIISPKYEVIREYGPLWWPSSKYVPRLCTHAYILSWPLRASRQLTEDDYSLSIC